VTNRLCSHRRGRIAVRRQRGIVLFIALIVMVAMTLAAIALIRSVDTTNTAIGNLAFRQASILPANYAVEAAAATLFPKDVNNGGPKIADLTKDDATLNYFSTFRRTDNKIGVPKELQTKTAARALPVQLRDGTDNEITYVIERMCDDKSPVKPGDGKAGLTWCDMLPPKQSTSRTSDLPGGITLNPVPFYRVTVRVDGPKNTASFLQADLR
jgi:type IV pilus assembly protein PilX